MSDPLGLFRSGVGPDLKGLSKLAEKHLQEDLRQSDRDALQTAASRVHGYTILGSFVGIGLGVLLAFRIRRSKQTVFRAFFPAENPQAVRFADGRGETVPDLAALLKPSRTGDIATYALLGAGGLFFGLQTGLLAGTFRARSLIAQDRESRDRILNAHKKIHAETLRAQADALEQSESGNGVFDGI